MAETEAALIPIRPGIYNITVAGHHFNHQRLTDGPHVTILPPSVHPDTKQEWQVQPGRKPGTITIARPGNIRPALSITFKGDHAHPKPRDRIVLQREPFSTDWCPVPAAPHRYFIRVPDHHGIPAHPPGFAVGLEEIHPPFLNLAEKEQLEWIFVFLRPIGVSEASEEA